MSVTFRKDGYSIDIETAGNPADDWIELQKEILTLIQYADENIEHHPWRAAHFLKELLPAEEDAKKMTQL